MSDANAVSIAAIEPDEFELAAEWFSRPETNRWLTSEWRGRDVTSRVVAMLTRKKEHNLFMVRLDDVRCGLLGIFDVDEEDGCASMFYLLGDTAMSGRGVMTRALRCGVEHAFDELGLDSVHAWIVEGNTPSRRMLEKNGFQPAARLRNATTSEGRRVDRVYFDLTRDEYERSRG